MSDFKLAGALIPLLAFCLFGCASLHVDVAPAVDWDKVSSVVLQEPPEDPWQLTPAIRAELQSMDLTVLVDDNADPDLLVRFFYEEGPDLNSEGDLITRLKSLHIQFVDPTTKKNAAVADYFYAETESEKPLSGVKAAFTGLRQDIRRSEPTQLQPTPVSVDQRSDDAPDIPTAQRSKEDATAIDKPAPAPQPFVRSKSTTDSHLREQEPAKTEQQTLPTAPDKRTVDQVRPTEETPRVTPPTAQAPATPTHERAEPEIRKIEPKTESPWVPRFQSWGFENWGEQPDDGY